MESSSRSCETISGSGSVTVIRMASGSTAYSIASASTCIQISPSQVRMTESVENGTRLPQTSLWFS